MSPRPVSAFAPLVAGALVAGALVAGALGLGCPGAGLGAGDALGKAGKVIFTTDTGLAFSSRLVVGSVFVVSLKATDAKLKGAVGGAALGTTDESVLVVDGVTVRVAGPGTAELQAVGADGFIDSIDIHAGVPTATALVDAALLKASDSLDARLPVSFAIRTGTDHQFFVAAVDKCGGDLLDLHASTLAPGGIAASVVDVGASGGIVVTTQVAGDLDLTLKTPGLADLAYTVKSIDPAAVDEVDISAISSDNTGNVTVWGRAFTNDVELVGDLQLSWTGSDRVTFAQPAGQVVSATVAFPKKGDPPDDRPATITAEIFGQQGTTDLLAPGLTTTTSRGTPARVPPDPAGVAGCGGSGGGGGCNPEAALAGVLGIASLRRLRSRAA